MSFRKSDDPLTLKLTWTLSGSTEYCFFLKSHIVRGLSPLLTEMCSMQLHIELIYHDRYF